MLWCHALGVSYNIVVLEVFTSRLVFCFFFWFLLFVPCIVSAVVFRFLFCVLYRIFVRLFCVVISNCFPTISHNPWITLVLVFTTSLECIQCLWVNGSSQNALLTLLFFLHPSCEVLRSKITKKIIFFAPYWWKDKMIWLIKCWFYQLPIGLAIVNYWLLFTYNVAVTS